tara:strand:- start:4022 stop:4849 length:828 start_codon:yes stop_codon:yes gene_type:complete
MFRKGGEVMEGVMTGIKPRENFKLGSPEQQSMISDVRGKIDLIDAIAGGGGQDGLSQFLIGGGLNLVSGENEGDTILQTLAGAYKQPTERLFAQQAKDKSGRRAIAASLIGKMGGDDISKIQRNAKKISELTGRPYDQVLNEGINKFLYKDPTNPNEIERMEKQRFAKNIMADKDNFGNIKINPEAIPTVTNEFFRVMKNDKIKDKIDISKVFLNIKDLKKAKATKVQTNEGQKNAFDASEIKGLENGYLYYRPKGKGGWVIYSEQDQALIPVNI